MVQKIALVLGTRPEIIKLSPVMRELDRQGQNYIVIHSNQHYSENMDKVFFEELALSRPQYNLGIGSAQHGNQTGRMLIAIEEVLLSEKPDVVLAQGDTNTVLAAILAASKLDIRCGHVEAGLRSYDRRMPEEKNRVLCDAIADDLFCPTEVQRNILKGEGIPDEKIYVTGNTIVDAVQKNTAIAEESDVLERLGLEEGKFSLLTAHRASNVDYEDALSDLARVVRHTAEVTGFPTVYPMHPRTRARLENAGLQLSDVIVVDPLGYRDFLRLEMSAHLIVTDSGGVQEEACILGVPCLTLRENTERPETVSVGANRLVGLDTKRFDEAFEELKARNGRWDNPFGDGRASERILDIIRSS
ncbi:UDP-N-acetylglucosamine 2-epimerase (non-hydrolyzing) [Deltaproteobacteria bacterium]|nr:UDP-N-acetylglucosamine 2-epimerase (non-hydrolyzing) [Deltaproteobacteria bacterium]